MKPRAPVKLADAYQPTRGELANARAAVVAVLRLLLI